MRIQTITDLRKIEHYLKKDYYLHLYGLGDLDSPFCKHTTWFAAMENDEIKAIALLYTGLTLPTFLALTSPKSTEMELLLETIAGHLPKKLYGHLTGGLDNTMRNFFKLESHGKHFKMGLLKTGIIEKEDTSPVERLTLEDIDEIMQLYELSYPGHWFESHMLQTGHYYGIWNNHRLISVAGVHVYSPRYNVAALGNITTHPKWRGKGLGTKVTAHLCKELMKSVEYIGLNVKCDNSSAINCYRNLGFEITHEYHEFMAQSISGF
ncbi:MAG: GNAT family N-acetyltransferase [candidate division Zixibacteria bacterium]|nr:GNAT family N-acetyltransferase [candidate division Zixibacteria bacterium]